MTGAPQSLCYALGMKRLLPAALALAAIALPQPGRAQGLPFANVNLVELDRGNLLLYQSDRFIGSEVFTLTTSGDSMLVSSRSFQVLPDGDTLRKDVAQVIGVDDFALRKYLSNQTYGGHKIVRGIELKDTLYTCYRQDDLGGSSDTFILPPGRVFVMDPKVFVCFDLICRSLHGKVFEQRPLQLLVLGRRDSMLQVTATDQGTETIRWGSRSVTARKLTIHDARLSFTVWAHPRGQLLRLAETTSGLRVEREPPPVKKATAPKPKPSG